MELASPRVCGILTTMTTTQTKRGDLVVVEYSKEYNAESVFELEMVSSVGRDGQVKATIRHSFGHDSEPEPFYRMSSSRGHQIRRYRCYSSGVCWIVAQNKLNTYADLVFKDCTIRTDSDHEWAPCEFASLDAIREWLAPYKIAS